MNKVKRNYPGVFLDQRRNHWVAIIKVNGKNKYLGSFDNELDAINKKKEAEFYYFDKRQNDRKILIKNIINLYASGKNLKEIGLLCNLHPSSIYYILKKENIHIRKTGENIDNNFIINNYVNNLESIENIAQKVNLSPNAVYMRLKKAKIKIRPNRKYFFDENMFADINCEWKAYFLGLLYADGCVRKLNIVITLTEKDSYLLDFFNKIIFNNQYKLICGKSYIYKDKKRNKTYIGKPKKTLIINSVKTVKDIINKGCIMKKSLTLNFPDYNIIPKELFHHFIRGYFDGDGHIAQNVFMLISSNNFCNGFKNWLQKEFNISSYLRSAGKVSRIFLHKKKYINFIYNFMYKDATIYLKRKKEKFEFLKYNFSSEL